MIFDIFNKKEEVKETVSKEGLENKDVQELKNFKEYPMKDSIGHRIYMLVYLGDLRFTDLKVEDITFSYDPYQKVFFSKTNPKISFLLEDINLDSNFELYFKEKISSTNPADEDNWIVKRAYTKKYELDSYYKTLLKNEELQANVDKVFKKK